MAEQSLISLPKFLFGHTRVLVYVRELYVSSLYIRSPVRTTFSGRIIGYYFPLLYLKILLDCTFLSLHSRALAGYVHRSLSLSLMDEQLDYKLCPRSVGKVVAQVPLIFLSVGFAYTALD